MKGGRRNISIGVPIELCAYVLEVERGLEGYRRAGYLVDLVGWCLSGVV